MESLVERLNDNAATKFVPSSLRTPGVPAAHSVGLLQVEVAPRSVSDNGEHNNKRRLCHLQYLLSQPFYTVQPGSGCMFV